MNVEFINSACLWSFPFVFLLDAMTEEMVDEEEEKDDVEMFEPVVDSSKLTFDKHEGIFPISLWEIRVKNFQGEKLKKNKLVSIFYISVTFS